MDDIDYAEIERHFHNHGYLWKVNGDLVFPTDYDIKKTVEKAVTKLADEPDGAMLEVGRLIVRKNHEGFDVFTMIGELE